MSGNSDDHVVRTLNLLPDDENRKYFRFFRERFPEVPVVELLKGLKGRGALCSIDRRDDDENAQAVFFGLLSLVRALGLRGWDRSFTNGHLSATSKLEEHDAIPTIGGGKANQGQQRIGMTVHELIERITDDHSDDLDAPVLLLSGDETDVANRPLLSQILRYHNTLVVVSSGTSARQVFPAITAGKPAVLLVEDDRDNSWDWFVRTPGATRHTSYRDPVPARELVKTLIAVHGTRMHLPVILIGPGSESGEATAQRQLLLPTNDNYISPFGLIV